MASLMLRYRIIRTAHESFVLGLFWVYVVLFVLALAMVFVFPPGAIALFFGSLVSLPFAVVGSLLLRMLRSGFAAMILRGGSCPCCGERMLSVRDSSVDWHCEFCAACFHPGGLEEPVSPVPAHSV